VTITDSEIDYSGTGLLVAPGANQTISPSSVANSYFDSNYVDGILIQPSSASGTVGPITFNNDWCSSNGIGSLVNPNGGTIDGVQFNGMRCLNNIGDGLNISGGTNISVSGSQYTGNGYQMTGGTVNTAGTVVNLVTAGSLGAGFITAMTNHSITINGIPYTVYSIQSATQITLSTSAGTQSGVSFSFGNPAISGIGVLGGSGNVIITGTHSGGGPDHDRERFQWERDGSAEQHLHRIEHYRIIEQRTEQRNTAHDRI
jgi:hypothetical protein